MKLFNTLITFNYPSESYALRSLLESEGIECFLKDEINSQTNPLGAHALGGVKLQVKTSEIEHARQIMLANGYPVNQNTNISEFWIKFDASTKSIPFIGALAFVYRYLIIATLIIFAILLLIYYLGRFLIGVLY